MLVYINIAIFCTLFWSCLQSLQSHLAAKVMI